MIARPEESYLVVHETDALAKSLEIALSSLKASASVSAFKLHAYNLLNRSIYKVLSETYASASKVASGFPSHIDLIKLKRIANKAADSTVAFISTSSADALDISSARITKRNVASKSRAKLIAEDNLYQAFYTGTRRGWATNTKVKKSWYTHSAHDQDDICDDNEEAEDIPINKPFPSGHQEPKAHFGCNCYLILVKDKVKKYKFAN